MVFDWNLSLVIEIYLVLGVRDLVLLTLVVVWFRFRFRFQLLLDTGGIDDDGRFTLDRALVLTDAAPGALLFLDDRAFLVVANDGLIGALLVADKTDLIRVPGDASGLIDVGHPHLNQAFLFERNRLDRLGGANPSAEITEFLTVSDPGNKPWRVKARKACLQEGRLERIVGTDLQTLCTPGAGSDESLFRQRTRRTNQPVIGSPALRLKRVGLDHQRRCQTKGEGAKNIPPRKVHPFHRLPIGETQNGKKRPGAGIRGI